MRAWVFAMMSLILLSGGIYCCTQYRNPGHKSTLETGIVNVQTTFQPVKGHTGSPPEFRDLSFTGGMPELKIVVTLSNSNVKIGETLWMKVKLIGERVYDIELLRMTIMNSKGQKVYDTYMWLPHRTLTPGSKVPREEIYNFMWKTSKHPSANVEVTPGDYTFLIKATVNGKDAIVNGTIRVI